MMHSPTVSLQVYLDRILDVHINSLRIIFPELKHTSCMFSCSWLQHQTTVPHYNTIMVHHVHHAQIVLEDSVLRPNVPPWRTQSVKRVGLDMIIQGQMIWRRVLSKSELTQKMHSVLWDCWRVYVLLLLLEVVHSTPKIMFSFKYCDDKLRIIRSFFPQG